MTDFQENLFSGSNFRTFNSDLESYGLELDSSISPVDGLTLQAGYAYTKAERKGDILAPDGTGFILIAHSAAALLPTIVSRCQRVRFTSVDAQVLTRWLEARGVDDAAAHHGL